ncbi:MAG: ATP-binding protein [Tenericutes bacterium]|jgi:MinD superfamily P-loop ATPase|nr:ATP-binding protein [Mycoplasmatota bacterium]
MKQLLVLSGKGGTGKTTIASSFIKLANSKQFADCDVEAPNLHLMYKKGEMNSKSYFGLAKAIINQELCIECGLCKDHCRFNAISDQNGYHINPYKCEGCGVCGLVCPAGAIQYEKKVDGSIDLYQNNYRFSTGSLKMGSGNSGLLVTEVKKQLNNHEDNLTIIDGPPGIGCPVIASMSGVDFILVVTEPSMSGFSDMKRMIETIKKMRIKMAVCINKYDINRNLSKKIKQYLFEERISYVGELPYDDKVNDLINQGISLVESNNPVGKGIIKIYDKVKILL